jgi:hypothetical protein
MAARPELVGNQLIIATAVAQGSVEIQPIIVMAPRLDSLETVSIIAMEQVQGFVEVQCIIAMGLALKYREKQFTIVTAHHLE